MSLLSLDLSNVNELTVPFFSSTTENTLRLCRYLVDSHWFKQWKKYVGFDSWDKYQMGEQNVYPGPVDNSGLLKGKKNKVQKIKPFCLHTHWKQCSAHILLPGKKGNKSKQRVAYLGASWTLQLTCFFAHWNVWKVSNFCSFFLLICHHCFISRWGCPGHQGAPHWWTWLYPGPNRGLD